MRQCPSRVHKVCLRVSNLALTKNLSPSTTTKSDFLRIFRKSPIAAGRRFSFPNHLHHIPAAEMEKRIMADLKQFERKMEKTLEVLASDFGAVRAGRANAQVLDRIEVEYYGTPTPISQVGTISSPDPRTLVIQPWDGSTAEADRKGHPGLRSRHQPAERRPRHPPRVPAADRGAPQGAGQAGQKIRRGRQGRHPQRPPRRGRQFVKKAQKKGETDRGRPEEGRKGHPGSDRQICQEGRRDVRQEGQGAHGDLIGRTAQRLPCVKGAVSEAD